jgi:predicted nucleic acid-binding protein
LDTSVTLAWLLPDEHSPATQQILDRVTTSGASVPALWHLEVANSLSMAVRRRRIDAAFRDASLADLALLNIHVDPDTSRLAWSATLKLADQHQLTLYDAAYLELALRFGLPLATLDRDLRAAASLKSVSLLGT